MCSAAPRNPRRPAARSCGAHRTPCARTGRRARGTSAPLRPPPSPWRNAPNLNPASAGPNPAGRRRSVLSDLPRRSPNCPGQLRTARVRRGHGGVFRLIHRARAGSGPGHVRDRRPGTVPITTQWPPGPARPAASLSSCRSSAPLRACPLQSAGPAEARRIRERMKV